MTTIKCITINFDSTFCKCRMHLRRSPASFETYLIWRVNCERNNVSMGYMLEVTGSEGKMTIGHRGAGPFYWNCRNRTSWCGSSRRNSLASCQRFRWGYSQGTTLFTPSQELKSTSTIFLEFQRSLTTGQTPVTTGQTPRLFNPFPGVFFGMRGTHIFKNSLWTSSDLFKRTSR